MSMKKTACFLDFDHTLFNTDEFFHVDVRGAFAHLGINPKWWEPSYLKAKEKGYSLEKHLETARRLSGETLPLKEMKQVLRRSFSNLSAYLFPDVTSFLKTAKTKGAALFLLSFGDPDWQKYKVIGAGLDKYFNKMSFVPKRDAKARFVKKQAAEFSRLIAVDNNPLELDLIKDAVPRTITYCINRVPDKMVLPGNELSRLKFLEARGYAEKAWRHRHIVCKNLDGILRP